MKSRFAFMRGAAYRTETRGADSQSEGADLRGAPLAYWVGLFSVSLFSVAGVGGASGVRGVNGVRGVDGASGVCSVSDVGSHSAGRLPDGRRGPNSPMTRR